MEVPLVDIVLWKKITMQKSPWGCYPQNVLAWNGAGHLQMGQIMSHFLHCILEFQ